MRLIRKMLRGKTVIVTGGSRGIGEAIVKKFAENGASVAIVYSNDIEAAKRVKKNCEDMSVRAEIFKCDVSDFTQVEMTVKDIRRLFGGFDILVNNAGIVKDGLAVVMREDDFDDVLKVNLKGTFNMIRMCLPIFIKYGGGKIINISSVVGLIGNPGQANYAASKAGIIGITKTIAREYAVKNINCNAIAPGFIETELTKEINNLIVKEIPMKRRGKPEDVADAALFLASQKSDYITGEVIRVDGGLAI